MNRRVIIIALVAASGCLAWAAGPVQSGIVWLAPADVSRLDDQALAKLPVKEQIAVLVQRLPEQTGRQVTLPGHCDIFETDPAVSRFRVGMVDERGKPYPAVTPAGKLFQIGLEAVPQLLDAIDDHRPTRGVGVGPPALDVGECAMQILQRLSGR
jgi:hypothetical protein